MCESGESGRGSQPAGTGDGNPFCDGYPEPSSVPDSSAAGPLRFQYSLGSILLLTTLAAVLLSIGTMNWGVAVALAILTFPALLRTAVTAAWRRSAGYPMPQGEKTTLFLASTLGVVLVGTAVVAAFFGTCFVGFLAGAALWGTMGLGGKYGELDIGFGAGVILGGIVALVTLFFTSRFALRVGRKTQTLQLDLLRAAARNGPPPVHPRE